MKTSATNRKLRLLLTGIRNGTLIPRPEFQRRLVWSNKHKREFLDTVLMGYPFPEIYIAAGDVDPSTGEGHEMLVDGQQRITTLYQYFLGSKDLPLANRITPYTELPEEKQREFLEYEVVVRDLGKKSIEEIIEIFRRINSTRYALNAMELHNARYDGQLKKYAEEMAQGEFFETNRVFTSQDIRRMGDIRFCLTIIITIMTTYFNRDEDLGEFLEKYNDSFTGKKKYDSELQDIYSIVEGMEFEPKSRVWKKADLLSLLVELHRSKYKDEFRIDPPQLGQKLKQFYTRVDSALGSPAGDETAVRYHKAALQATNDRSSRIFRGEVIRAIIRESSEEQALL